jgi:hypothetical protein
LPLACATAKPGNAGDAHIYGGEFETSVLLTEGLILSINAGYTDATIVSSSAGVK